jgi:subtilase family serine protease
MKSSDTNVTVRGEVSYGNGPWIPVGSDQTIDKSKLTKGAWVSVSWKYTVPTSTAGGTLMKLRFTTDSKNVVSEKYEDNNQKTEVFTIQGPVRKRTPEERRRFYNLFLNLIIND